MFNIRRCSACYKPSRTWITFNRSLTIFEAFGQQFTCAALIASSPKVFWIIQIFSPGQCASLMQNLMQIHCSALSVILNAMTTQCTCSLSGIYHPHWLVQWSHYCSHMYISVHSPWLPGYIDVTQTIVNMLTVAGLFLDRPHMCCLLHCPNPTTLCSHRWVQSLCRTSVIAILHEWMMGWWVGIRL